MSEQWIGLLSQRMGVHHFRKSRSFAVSFSEQRTNARGAYITRRRSTSRFNTEAEGEAYLKRLADHAKNKDIHFYGGKFVGAKIIDLFRH